MNLQVSPNNWSCAAVSLAMALDRPYKRIIDLCGHDGSAKVWQAPYHNKEAGFHIHELIDVAWTSFKKTMTPFVRSPMATPSTDQREQTAIFAHYKDHERRFVARIFNRVGIMTGFAHGSHAVAWDGSRIYDPRGYVYYYDDRQKYYYEPDVFWMVGGDDVSAFTVVS